MTNENGNQEHLAFDQIELHSDINVHEQKKPPRREEKPAVRKHSTAQPSRAPFFLMFLLFLGAAGGAGYFYMEHQKLSQELASLAAQAANTSETLEATKTDLDLAKNSMTDQMGTLEQTQANLSSLKSDLNTARNENTRLKKQMADHEAKLSKQEADLKANQSELAAARKKQATAEANLANMRKERDSLKDDLTTQKKTSEEKITQLEGELATGREELVAKLNEWEKKEKRLQADLSTQSSSAQRLESQFKEEAEASRKILQEVGQLRRENSDLKSSKRKADREIGELKDKVAQLEGVSFGELVPFSEALQLGQVRYREPLPDGIKIPRKMGKAVVHVLVNEVGNVEKAVILPDQEMEAELSSALARTIYKWKFTPPTLNGIRVKAWQPILIAPE